MRYARGGKDKHQNITLELSSNRPKGHTHRILPHLMEISPQKANFDSKIAIFPFSWHFFAGHSEKEGFFKLIFL